METKNDDDLDDAQREHRLGVGERTERAGASGERVGDAEFRGGSQLRRGR